MSKKAEENQAEPSAKDVAVEEAQARDEGGKPTNIEGLRAKLDQVAQVLEQEKASGAHQNVQASKMATAGGPTSLRAMQKPGGPVTDDAISKIWNIISPLGPAGLELLLGKLFPWLP